MDPVALRQWGPDAYSYSVDREHHIVYLVRTLMLPPGAYRLIFVTA